MIHILSVEECALRVPQLRIEHQFIDQHITHQHIHIDKAFEIGLVTYGRLEPIKLIHHAIVVEQCLILTKLWRFDVDREPIRIGVELPRLVIRIQLEECCLRFIIKVYTIVGHAHLLGEIVASSILTIHIEFHGNHIVGRLQPHHTGYLMSHRVGHE